MARANHWTGGGYDGLWSDPANWSAGVPGSHSRVVFSGFSPVPQGTQVSLASSDARNPVAGTVAIQRGDVVFQSGRLVLHGVPADPTASLLSVAGGAQLTIDSGTTVVATAASGSGVSVVSAGLEVNGTLHASTIGLEGGGDLGNAYIGIVGEATAQQLSDRGASLVVADGGHLAAASLFVGAYETVGGALSVQGDGTLVRAGNLDLAAGSADIGSSAHLEVAYGTEGGAGQPAAMAVTGTGSVLRVTHMFDQQSGTLELTDGGQLMLSAHATFLSCGTVTLDGGGIAGPGVLTLDGGTLEAASGTQDVPGRIGILGGGVLEAAQGATLALDGPVSGSKAVLTIGGNGMDGTVALNGSADDYSGTAIAAGTLQLNADNAAGTGRIGFVGGDGTLAVGAGIDVGNIIAGLGGDDRLDLLGIAYGAGTTLDVAPVPGGTMLGVSDGIASETLHLAGSYAAAGFSLSADGQGGTDVAYAPQGTMHL